MRRVTFGLLTLALAGCGRADEQAAGPGIDGTMIAGVAFTYRYGFALPGPAIADIQEAHAAACERLGAQRCRITGLGYHVDGAGAVSAELSVALAAPVARAFGRQAVATVVGAGGLLTGADIGGTEAAMDATASLETANEASGDDARVSNELDRRDLGSAERAQLRADQAAAIERRRQAAREADALRRSVTTTPMTFAYAAGRGTGFVNRLRDTLDTGLASTTLTATALLWVFAALGPPAIVLALLFLVWRRWGRYAWARLVGTDATG